MSEHETAGRALYRAYENAGLPELEEALAAASEKEEKLFWRTLINLKLQTAQEKVVGEQLL